MKKSELFRVDQRIYLQENFNNPYQETVYYDYDDCKLLSINYYPKNYSCRYYIWLFLVKLYAK